MMVAQGKPTKPEDFFMARQR